MLELTVEELIDRFACVRKGRYVSCICPKCGEPEAYFYADELHQKMIRIHCNRLNHCGTVTCIRLLDHPMDPVWTEPAQSVRKVTDQGLALLETAMRNANQLSRQGCLLWSGWRGVSRSTLDEAGIIWHPVPLNTWVQLKHKPGDFAPELETPLYNRDLWIPIRNAKGKLERLLLRSLHPSKEERLKEVNLALVDDAAEIWNLQDLFDPQKTVCFITEGVVDALSIREILPHAAVVALPGVQKYRKLLKEIDQMETFSKTLVICFDSDAAGLKYSAALLQNCQTRHLAAYRLNLKGHKDLNDWLNEDRPEMERTFQRLDALNFPRFYPITPAVSPAFAAA